MPASAWIWPMGLLSSGMDGAALFPDSSRRFEACAWALIVPTVAKPLKRVFCRKACELTEPWRACDHPCVVVAHLERIRLSHRRRVSMMSPSSGISTLASMENTGIFRRPNQAWGTAFVPNLSGYPGPSPRTRLPSQSWANVGLRRFR